MAIIRQAAPIIGAAATQDAGVESGSTTVFGWPIAGAALGIPGSVDTAGEEPTTAIIRQAQPLASAGLLALGTLTAASAPPTTALIRQTAPIISAATGRAGTLVASTDPPGTSAIIRQSAPIATAATFNPGVIESVDLEPLDIRIVIGAPYTRWRTGRVYA